MSHIDGWKDKILFTPGPLTTSRTVKQAMLRDLGSRDFAFIGVIKDIRARLLRAGAVEGAGYEAIPMQGSGTFSVEAVFASVIRPGGCVLVIVNGAYGQRMLKMCQYLGIETIPLLYPENTLPDLHEIETALQREARITEVATVHCETTTGIFNPVAEIGALCAASGKRFFVDAMSSFGAVALNLAEANIDYLVSSANKCIEGVPGFGFCIARREALLETDGWARSLSLDLLDQWRVLEKTGQFRFTPPTHALLAFHQALLELEQEGGVPGRASRYRSNYETLIAGMAELGFEEYLPRELQGYIITSFRYPAHENWDFEDFYTRLNERGYVIYPGKVSDADCFRIGNIGRIFKSDVQDLIAAIAAVLREMDITLAAAPAGS